MKILVPGFYTWANKGDAALLLSFLPWISDNVGAAEFVVTSFTPEEDSTFFGVPVIDMPTRPGRRFHRAQEKVARRLPGGRVGLAHARALFFRLLRGYLMAWSRLYKRAPRLGRLLVPRHVYRVAGEISAADAVVTVPGGYLNAYRSTNDWWLFHLPTLWMAHALGKPPILGPCSLGPFHPLHEAEARYALSLAELVLVRERPSYDLAMALGVPAGRLLQTPDMAFRFDREEVTPTGKEVIEEIREAASGRPLVGISVRDHNYPGHDDPVAMQDTYLDAVVESAASLQVRHGAFPVIVPQTMEDQRIGAELERRLRVRSVEALNLSADLTPGDLQAIYAELRLLIGTRMHANILAMSAGTSVAAIAYEPKTVGILEAMRLDGWGVAIDKVSGGALVALVEAQWVSADAGGRLAAERAAEQRALLDDAGTAVARALNLRGQDA